MTSNMIRDVLKIALRRPLCFCGFKNPQTRVVSPLRYLRCDNRHGEPDGPGYPLNAPAANANLLILRHANEHFFSHRDPDMVCAEPLAEAEAQGYA